jgi:hypothetical protein
VLPGRAAADTVYVHGADFYNTHDIDLVTGDAVNDIDRHAGKVTTRSGRMLPFDRLLLATGARPRRLPLDGGDLDGITTLRTLDDARALIARLRQTRHVTVVGAGWIGCEVAASARQRGVDVTVVELADRPLERVLGPELGDFYAPAVVVVLLQHMLVTFIGLSLVREMELGTTELYRVAPLRVSELLVGKYFAYTLISALVSTALVGALVVGLGVPMLGSWAFLALALLAVVLASCGLGLCVAALARGATQAVQYTMLILLVTVFFSGFLLSLDRFLPPFLWVGYLVPATYGVELLRTTMLHGFSQPAPLAALALFALLLGAVGWVSLSFRLRRS